MTDAVNQEGGQLQTSRFSHGGRLRPMGRVSLADALGRMPKGGTFVTGEEPSVPLNEGETWMSETTDPYCAALLHVDSVK